MKIERILTSTIIPEKTFQQIKSGHCFQFSRLCIVSTKTAQAIVSMNIFERALAVILTPIEHIVHFNYKTYVLNQLLQKTNSAAQSVLHTTPSVAPPPQSALDPRREMVKHYCEEQQRKNEPIDLIVGRGKRIDQNTPTLLKERDFADKKSPYTPLLLDIDPSADPDVLGDITDLKSMECFDPESIDEIYLERIFPPSVQTNPTTYFNAARLLKPGGKLLIDFSSLCPNTAEDQEGSARIIMQFLSKYGLPFVLSLEDVRRNTLSGKKLVLEKCDVYWEGLSQKKQTSAAKELQKAYIRPKLL